LDGADCFNDQCQAVFWGHAGRSMWNVALQSTTTAGASARIAAGYACRHQVCEIIPYDPGLSTAGSTTVCVKPEENGPKRRNKLAQHGRQLRSQANSARSRPLKILYGKQRPTAVIAPLSRRALKSLEEVLLWISWPEPFKHPPSPLFRR
jgi:hypothetical protein